MNKKLYIILLAGLMLGFSACENDEQYISSLDEQLDELISKTSGGIGHGFFKLPTSDDYASIPQDPNNELTHAKVELGKLLFHETGFGIDGEFGNTKVTYSCASCHHAGAGFQAGVAQGIGEGGDGFGIRGEVRKRNPLCAPELCDVQPLRTPTTINVAYQPLMIWNGQFGAGSLNQGTEDQWTEGTPKAFNHLGFEGVETQAIAGLGVHRLTINDSLVSILGYRNMFDAAFSNYPSSERYSSITAGLAIAAYERTMLSDQAPFQRYLDGNRFALSQEEKHGAILFFGKADCVSCHTGPALNKMEFHALGMGEFDPDMVTFYVPDDPAQLGRYSFTQREGDQYRFKTPQLYNLRNVGFLGHGATFSTIKEVIKYKNEAIPQRSDIRVYLSPAFQPLRLTDAEVDYLTQFIENGLNDPNLDRYVPISTPTNTCFPNADVQSKVDLGCD